MVLQKNLSKRLLPALKNTITEKCSVIFSIDFLTKFEKFFIKDSVLLSLKYRVAAIFPEHFQSFTVT